MPDTQTTAPQEGDDQTQQPQAPQDGKTFDADYVDRLRREAAKYRTEARANAEKASRFDELEAAKKTELEKLAEDRDTHRKRGEVAELAAARYEIALEKGLSKSQAKRLVGSTRDELLADADELLSDLDAGKPKQPRPNPAQGAAPAPTGSGDWLRDRLTRT